MSYELCKVDDRRKVAPAMLLDDENNLHRGISVQECHLLFAILYHEASSPYTFS